MALVYGRKIDNLLLDLRQKVDFFKELDRHCIEFLIFSWQINCAGFEHTIQLNFYLLRQLIAKKQMLNI